PELVAVDDEDGALAVAGEGAANRVGTGVVDDREAVAGRRREAAADRDVEGAAAQGERASHAELVVVGAGGRAVQLDREVGRAVEGDVAAGDELARAVTR